MLWSLETITTIELGCLWGPLYTLFLSSLLASARSLFLTLQLSSEVAPVRFIHISECKIDLIINCFAGQN